MPMKPEIPHFHYLEYNAATWSICILDKDIHVSCSLDFLLSELSILITKNVSFNNLTEQHTEEAKFLVVVNSDSLSIPRYHSNSVRLFQFHPFVKEVVFWIDLTNYNNALRYTKFNIISFADKISSHRRFAYLGCFNAIFRCWVDHDHRSH